MVWAWWHVMSTLSVMGRTVCPLKSYVEALTPRGQKVMLFGDWAFKEVGKGQRGPSGSDLIPSVVLRRGNSHPRRDGGDARAQRKGGRGSRRDPGGSQPCQPLHLGPPASRT